MLVYVYAPEQFIDKKWADIPFILLIQSTPTLINQNLMISSYINHRLHSRFPL